MEITTKSAWLKELQDHEETSNVDEIRSIQLEINTLLEQEDIRWKQRAKRTWYRCGDKNTKFFHTYANQRRKKNLIKSISTESN